VGARDECKILQFSNAILHNLATVDDSAEKSADFFAAIVFQQASASYNPRRLLDFRLGCLGGRFTFVAAGQSKSANKPRSSNHQENCEVNL